MKYKSKYDIGEKVHCLFTEEIDDIIKTISKNTWIYETPELFISFLNDNFNASLEAVKYIPNIYFQLNDRFKNDNLLIKTTINAFKKYGRIDEINIKYKPIKKRKNKISE